MQRSIVIAAFTVLSAIGAHAQTARELLQKSILSIEGLRTARYTLDKVERFPNKIIQSEVLIKLSVNPNKVYLYSISPNPGAEVLYVKGLNNNHALVNANKFPFVSIKLQTDGALLRNEQHHTLTAMGFDYLKDILKSSMNKLGEGFYQNLTYEGLVDWKNKQYHKLVIENKSFAYYTYEAQRGETISSIANKLGVSDYMILSVNPQIKDYDNVRAGQKIKVPNTYAKRIVLYLDKVTYLPVVQQIYDDKGLFEQYEMSNFVYNATFDPLEFTPKYKDYHF